MYVHEEQQKIRKKRCARFGRFEELPKKNLTVSSCQPSAAERRNVLKETVKIIEKPKRTLAEKLCVRYLGKEHTTYMYIDMYKERESARVEEKDSVRVRLQ